MNQARWAIVQKNGKNKKKEKKKERNGEGETIICCQTQWDSLHEERDSEHYPIVCCLNIQCQKDDRDWRTRTFFLSQTSIRRQCVMFLFVSNLRWNKVFVLYLGPNINFLLNPSQKIILRTRIVRNEKKFLFFLERH